MIYSLVIFFSHLEPVHYSMFRSNCCFSSFLKVSQETGKEAWYSHLLKNFPQFVIIHTVQDFGIVNEAEIVFCWLFGVFLFLFFFLKFPCFFYDPADVGNLISGSSAFSISSLNIWKFSAHIRLKPGLENFEHYFASMWNECSCLVVFGA